MMKFKAIFPEWKQFKQFITDYQFYYKDSKTVFTDQNTLVYYTILMRNFANSHLAFDMEVFLEMFSMTISENFREFFIIRDLIDLIASKKVEELIIGLETINNIAENPNIETNKDTIVDYHQGKSGQSTGFLFKDATSEALAKALRKALLVYRDKRRWQGLQRRGMKKDFSWKKSAMKYMDLYLELLSGRRV